MEIPYGPDVMTPEWLTQALRQSGTITTANVLSFQTHAVGAEGEGITGQVVRVKLVYDFNEPAAPHSLIAKFHAADLQTRAAVNSLGMYANEFRFYQHIAGRTALPTSHCYYGDFHESGLTVLLLEDLVPARSLGWALNSSQVALAIQQIARFHAFWWERPEFVNLIGEEYSAARQKLAEMLQHRVQEKWTSVLGLAGDILPQPMVEIGQRIVNNWAAILDQLHNQPPRTFIHGDFNGDNLFFAAGEDGAPFSVIDWQLSKPSKGTYDVGMLIGGLPTEQRRLTETGLLKMYHQILIDNGVKGYSFEQCMDDYRLTMLDCFARLVFVIREPFPGEDLDRYHATDHKFREVELPRRCAAILDLGADKLLIA